MHEEKMKTGNFRWLVLVICFLVTMFGASNAYKVTQLVSYWLPDLNFSTEQVGMINSAASVGGFVMAFLTPAIMKKTGPARLVKLCMILLTVVPTGLAFANNFGIFYIILIISGGAFIMCMPATMQLVTNWFPLKDMGTANGILMVGASAMGIVLTPLTSALCGYVGWRTQYVIMGAVSIIIVIISFWLTDFPNQKKNISNGELSYIQEGQPARETGSTGQLPKASILKALNKNTILIILYSVALQIALTGMSWVWYGGTLLNADTNVLSLLYSISTIIVVFYGFIHGKIILNKLMHGNTRGTLILSAAVPAVTYAVAMFLPMPWQVWALLIFTAISIATGAMKGGTIGSYLALTVGPENVGSIYSLQNGICSGVGALFGSMAGRLINYNTTGIVQLNPLYTVCMAASVVGIVLLLFAKKANAQS